jgi:hypothetical protein
MRRSLIISSVLAATAALGACSNGPANNGTNNVKPTATATPVATATPASTPATSPSPVASPGKTTAPVNGNVKSTPEKKPVSTPGK